MTPAIFGLSGLALTADERAFFRDADPLGFILFARNIDTVERARRLVDDLRSCVARSDAPVLIDQEGGRVARLRPPNWRKAPPARLLGNLYARNPEQGLEATRLNSRLLAADVASIGCDVDCLPVLDIAFPETHAVIGDRAYADRPEPVAALGRAAAEGLLADAGHQRLHIALDGMQAAAQTGHIAAIGKSFQRAHRRRTHLEFTALVQRQCLTGTDPGGGDGFMVVMNRFLLGRRLCHEKARVVTARRSHRRDPVRKIGQLIRSQLQSLRLENVGEIAFARIELTAMRIKTRRGLRIGQRHQTAGTVARQQQTRFLERLADAALDGGAPAAQVRMLPFRLMSTARRQSSPSMSPGKV